MILARKIKSTFYQNYFVETKIKTNRKFSSKINTNFPLAVFDFRLLSTFITTYVRKYTWPKDTTSNYISQCLQMTIKSISYFRRQPITFTTKKVTRNKSPTQLLFIWLDFLQKKSFSVILRKCKSRFPVHLFGPW